MAYVLQHRLGRGGMGVVDLALGPDGRPVAIKRLALHGSVHEMARARHRIRREAEALRRLDHPHIVRLLDVYDDGDEVILVMPYLGGGTLADQVAAHGPLRPEQVAALAPPLLGALASAHRQGVVHRDIKPANVLFDLEGRPYLADFGIAALRDATSGLTATGTLLGTPEFMAPEQARGEPVTVASDVFALGATLTFALTGTPPWGRGDPRVLVARAAKGKVPVLPGSVPAALRHQLQPMLDRSPRRRPTAAAARGGPAGTAVLAPSSRRPAWLGAVAGAALGTAATAAAIWLAVPHGGAPTSSSASSPTTTAAPTSTTVPCQDQPYRPCGEPAAPFTDGVRCTDDHADYDGDATTGCEAAPDGLGDVAFTTSTPIVANLVPETNIDRYPFHVDDNPDLFCGGAVRVTLTAPKGASMHLDLLRDRTIIGSAISTDGRPASVDEGESCFGDDTGELVARVTWSGDRRTASTYRLERSGSF